MGTTRASYGARLLSAIERAQAATTCGEVTLEERRAEIIDLSLQGLTVPEMRAFWVAHLSGAPLLRGLKRVQVVKALRTKILSGFRCATIGCGAQITVEISYNFRGEDETTTDLVCTPCANSYERRPVLRKFTRRTLQEV